MKKEDKATIFSYNEAEDQAIIVTHSKKLKNQLAKLAAERPDEVQKAKEEKHAVMYCVPKTWIKVKPPRRLTPEQIEAQRERGIRMRESMLRRERDG